MSTGTLERCQQSLPQAPHSAFLSCPPANPPLELFVCGIFTSLSRLFPQADQPPYKPVCFSPIEWLSYSINRLLFPHFLSPPAIFGFLLFLYLPPALTSLIFPFPLIPSDAAL